MKTEKAELKTQRKLLLEQQTELRQIMLDPARHDQAIRLFLSQHASLHAAAVAPGQNWSFEDQVFADLPAEAARRLPAGSEHTIAWLIWHMARCEDITLNLLVAGSPQVLLSDGWLGRLGTEARDTGNAMDAAQLEAFSQSVDLAAARAYRAAVGRRTQEIVAPLRPQDLQRKVEPAGIKLIREQGAVLPAAWGIAEYWGRRTVAGLLLMPATRHNLIHLNEAVEIRRKVLRSPTGSPAKGQIHE